MEKKQKPGVMLYFDIRPAIQRLNMVQRGELLTAILDYAEFGIVSELGDMTGICFDLMRPKIDHDDERYEEVGLKKRYATYCREAKKDGEVPVSFEEWLSSDNRIASSDTKWYPSATTSTTTSPSASTTTTAAVSTSTTTTVSTPASEKSPADKPPRVSRFTPPTVEEVKAYCVERENGVDAERFVDFYTSKGWKVGKDSMKDWKAAVRTWEKREAGDKPRKFRVYDATGRDDSL